MVMIDDFDWRHSRHTPAPAPEPAPPPITAIDGLMIAEAEATELEKALKKRISALLKANHGLSELRTASSAAQNSHALALQESKQLPLPQTTTDMDVLTAFFTRHEELHCAVFSTQSSQSLADFALAKAVQEVVALADELARTCQAISSRPELATNAVVLAALHLANRSALPKQTLPAAPTVTAESNSDEIKRTGDLKACTLHLMVTMARAKELAARVRTISALIEKCSACKDIVEPVRPNEEEVQRYLHQLEERMIERQAAHRQGNPLFKEQNDMLEQLGQAKLAFANLPDAAAAPSESTPYKLRAAMVLAQIVQSGYESVPEELRRASRQADKLKGSLDTFEQVTPSKKEAEQIEVLRKAMHELAQSLGRLNEAKSAKAATKSIAEVTVERSGISASLDLKEALAWLAQNDAQQDAANKHNTSRDTKLELLQESIRAYTKECQSIETTLHRLNVSLLPKRNQKPCDILRALINAAAWMYSDQEVEEAVFPVY